MTQPIPALITENLWWLLPDRLGGVRMPRPDELTDLQSAGVGAIVSVFHEPANLELYQQAQIPNLWLPIAIDSGPTLEQIQLFQQFVEHQNQSGHAVAVHCSTGKHRTGTMLAAYLIQTGWSSQDAIQAVLKASAQTELPASQTTFLQNLSVSAR
jgi:atypical dual specificity phosphatase